MSELEEANVSRRAFARRRGAVHERMPEPVEFKPTIVDKPWGHELIWAKTSRYVGKILHVRAGEALSLQYHCVKDETIMVLSGRMKLEFFVEGEPPRVLELGLREPFHIAPALRHRMIAIDDTDVLEVSTPELEDVERIEDRYGRVLAR